ncbi:MAG: hypothetical protein C0626_02770 [Arcobacter sp.]|uniref:DUF3095 domain-containing protein n=1 Tax=uncultured Arcobacter sp. TaxID=165434 RepID=UPI000CC0775A|nr:DUF3095 domain-containing protein [uncultured Arcobacter sp.]PLY11502.1 MAG: hypothetical protein C0626_02770 [Arcobacter sp.]
MNTTQFYKELEEIKDFSQIMDDSNYSKIPENWYVLVSDIKGSTKAIEKGMYKKVNFVAALAIIGVLNIDKNSEFPYIFGGDGASLIIPPHLLDRAKVVLLETAKKAKDVFELDLRVGVVSVKEIKEKGSFIEITKFRATKDYTQAIVRGNGLELAEDLLKKEYKTFKIDENFTYDYLPDFDGLECRWEDIKSPKEETIALLIKSTNLEKSNVIYQNVLNKIDEIAGSQTQRNPIKEINQLNVSFNPKVLNTEASLSSLNIFSKFFAIIGIIIENLLGVFLMKFSIGKWGDYKNRIMRTTDTEKFDDMLRMVISTDKIQTKELEDYLEKEYQDDYLVYGIHKSDSALMTCLIFERHGKHIHFVDSSNGGYALASKALKARLKAKE